jgi:hypothetical protein
VQRRRADAIVRAPALIYRQAEAAGDECREILWYMIRSAFNVSTAHRLALAEYLAAIEQGREPSEEAVVKFASQRDVAESEHEVVHGSGVLLTDSKGTQLFSFDFASNEQGDRAIEFQVLDETGAPAYSLMVRSKGADPEE